MAGVLNNLTKPLKNLFAFERVEQRQFTGALRLLNVLILGGTLVYHLSISLGFIPDPIQMRATHILLFCILVFLNYPVSKRLSAGLAMGIDLIFILLSVLSFGYVIKEYAVLQMRIPFISSVSTMQVVLGLMAMVVIVEATRRLTGPIIPLIVIGIVGYAMLGKASVGAGKMTLSLLVEEIYLLGDGVFGLPTAVSAKYIVLFIAFASLLSLTGLNELMMSWSYKVAKWNKAATIQLPVISSALVGSVVGSSTANAVATGSVTIPLLKRLGFKGEFAAAIETCASTGGLFLPPVMGAVAFVMSEFTGIPYVQIAFHALVPALMYYFALGLAVYLRAKKRDLLDNLDEQALEKLAEDTDTKGLRNYLIVIPVVVLVYLLVIGKSPMHAASSALLVGLVISQIRPGWKWRPEFFEQFVKDAGLTSAAIVPVMVCAGMIVTSISATGLDAQLVFMIRQFSANLFLGLISAALLSIVLGLGMPIIAAYIIQVGIVVPLLVEFGLSPLQANLFLIFFAAVSMMTPPVAVTAYAAAGIAKADPVKTGLTAVRIGFASYFIPFVFAINPKILLIGGPWEGLASIVITLASIIALTAALEGWLGKHLSLLERLVFAGVAAALFISFRIEAVWLPILGLAAFFGGLYWYVFRQSLMRRRAL
ncbi:MAG: TRAP transporter fused permease subunit [Firmicutes bacterium]|nr:TRAP transporter fused permease subunit [Bacillota bacterium]